MSSPKLTEAKNSRQFFTLAMETLGNQRGRKVTYAEVARKGGFSSRSYPREVATGRRTLTRDACASLAKALDLNLAERKLFAALVELEIAHRDGHDPRILSLEEKLAKLRSGVETSRQVSFAKGSIPRVHYWAEVYAALGEADIGATLPEIASRMGRFSKSQIESKLKPVLEELIQNEIVRKGEGGRYIAKDFYTLFSKHQHHALALEFFSAASKEMLKRAPQKFADPSNLYRSISVSVDSKQMPELARRLQETVDQFIAEAETPKGDRIANLILAFD